MRLPSVLGLFTVVFLLLVAAPAFAQTSFGFVNNITSVPVPGSGHDYLRDLAEIVNPANGSLSVRIEAPRPKERALNYPFYSFMYDSTQQFAIQYLPNTVGQSYSCGSDTAGDNSDVSLPTQPLTCIVSVAFPYQSLSYPSGEWGVVSGPNSLLSTSVTYARRYSDSLFPTCTLRQGYSYEDPYGVIHDLGVYSASPSGMTGACGYLGISANPFGGDADYKVVLSDQLSGVAALNMIDTHGNSFSLVSGALEDTNGNYVSGTGRTGSYQSFQPWGDSLSQTATRTFAGGASYAYTWGTATTSFSPSSVDESKLQLGYDDLCTAPALTTAPKAATNNVVVKMVEPDGLYYTFSYDPVYGLLNKITYPTGAWVEYTWGVNSLSDATGFATPGQAVNYFNDPIRFTGGTVNTSCMFEHDTPAITKRVVSYDGVTPAMQQDFAYSTVWQAGNYQGQWTSKQTIVTTKDLISTGTPSFQTVYNYTPWPAYQSIGSHLTSSPIPVESTIIYKDTAGNTLQTVTKAWDAANQLTAECTTLPNGKSSGIFYQYESYPVPPGGIASEPTPTAFTTNLHTDVAEYDYGSVTTPCQKPSTTPTRETATTYASFANTPLWPTFSVTSQNVQVSMPPMVDRPATVITYQNGTRVAETDYNYDQTAVATVPTVPIGHDETNYGNGSSVPRGNPTTVTRQCFQGSTACTPSIITVTYDTTGQPVTVTDANNNLTKISYADSYTTDDGSPTGNTNTYPTIITRPTTNGVSHIESFQWDFNKGQLRAITDENTRQSTFQYADPWWRLTQSSFPDGGSVTKTYQDAGPNPTVTTNTLITSGSSSTSTTIMDGLGHVLHTEMTSDPDGVDYVDTTYDGFGRVASVTNPYRSTSDSSYGLAKFSYDSLGRKTIQIQTDGSKLQWCFNNVASSGQTNCAANASSLANTSWVDSSDEAGNHWQHVSDALGRMVAAMEPNGTTQAPSLETDYTYDGLDNLLSVNQKGGSSNSSNWRTRSFAYDSLSRLTQSTNPEAGTIKYSYDGNGNLLQKIAPAPNQTGSTTVTLSYCYDALNRITGKAYTAQTCQSGVLPTPLVSYYYDQASYNGLTISNGIGRRTGMADQAGKDAWSYDSMGRVLSDSRTTNAITKTTTFTYLPYVDGSVNSITYPTGRSLTFAIGGAERALSVKDGVSGTYYANGAHYLPNGALANVTDGTNISITNIFNPRFQPCWIYATSGTSLPWNSTLCNGTASAGSMLDYKYTYNLHTSDNGNVASLTNNRDATRSQSFTYDSLNRISTAQAAGGTVPNANCWGLTYGYDPWGNMLQASTTGPTGCSEPTPLNATASTSNRIASTTLLGNVSNYCYDSAGNQIFITAPATSPGTACPTSGPYQFIYDAENHLTTAAAVNYTYDGDGRRVQKSDGKIYWYGTSSDALSETDSAGNTTSEYVFFAGKRIAMIAADDLTNNGFEQGATGWTLCSTGQIVSNSSNAHSGTDYLQESAAAGASCQTQYSQFFAVSPGMQIDYGGWAYLQSGSGGYVRWNIGIYDSNHNFIRADAPNPNTVTSATWTYQTTSYTVPAGVAYVQIYAEIYQPTATTVARFDDAFLNMGGAGVTSPLYYVEDMLGTSRVITNTAGAICYDADFYPFGGERAITNTCPQNYKFTGKERDQESGLDYFGARYYGSNMGRFMSPDWAAKAEPVPYAKLDNPQSLNLYSYVLNNPLSRTDPDGHEVDFDQNAKKGEKLLLKNVSKAERKMFEVTKNADGKSVLGLKAGAEDNFKGNHTEGYNRLTTAINSDKVETINVAKSYTDAQGVSHNVSREDGGGVTRMYANGNSTIYVSPSGNPGQLTGVNGQAISDPLSIIMGHETLGHGLENAIGGDRGQHRAIEIENILRGEQKQPQRAQDPE